MHEQQQAQAKQKDKFIRCRFHRSNRLTRGHTQRQREMKCIYNNFFLFGLAEE